jgi:cell division protein FtsL
MTNSKLKILLIFDLVLLVCSLGIYSYNSIPLSQQENFEDSHAIFLMGLTPSQYNSNIYRLSMEQLYPSSSVQLRYLLFFQIPLITLCLGVMSVGTVISLMFYRRHRKTFIELKDTILHEKKHLDEWEPKFLSGNIKANDPTLKEELRVNSAVSKMIQNEYGDLLVTQSKKRSIEYAHKTQTSEKTICSGFLEYWL